MKLFKKKDGGILQIIEKEKIAKWDPETPVLFISYFRDNILPLYEDTKLRTEVSKYLDSVMEEVAVPKLVETLKGKDAAKRLETAQRLEELSRKNSDLVKPTLAYLKDLQHDPDKKIATVVKKIVTNYERAQKRKAYNEKRRKMRELDRKLAAGKITDAQYLKQRKEFLKLEQELGGPEGE
ncbi:MAG: hypothetical protein ACTSU5_10000 [Promethearchaeota archaeon]